MGVGETVEDLRQRMAINHKHYLELSLEIDKIKETNERLRGLLVDAKDSIEVLKLLGAISGHETILIDTWLAMAKKEGVV